MNKTKESVLKVNGLCDKVVLISGWLFPQSFTVHSNVTRHEINPMVTVTMSKLVSGLSGISGRHFNLKLQTEKQLLIFDN